MTAHLQHHVDYDYGMSLVIYSIIHAPIGGLDMHRWCKRGDFSVRSNTGSMSRALNLGMQKNNTIHAFRLSPSPLPLLPPSPNSGLPCKFK